MELQLIRNATLRFHYGQRLFIIDPYLAEKHSLPSYTGSSPNPLVDLPLTPEEVLADIEMTLVSHRHTDHFDRTAQQLLPKTLPIYCQPGDEDFIADKGFQNITPIHESVDWEGILITRTAGRHGEGQVLAKMGPVSGFVFQAAGEPTVYWAGDTIWCDPVRQAIEKFLPQIIITHSCGAVWGDSAPIVMDAAQTIAVCQTVAHSTIIATHMEALDHATVSRADLRSASDRAGIDRERLLIPLDGEKISF